MNTVKKRICEDIRIAIHINNVINTLENIGLSVCESTDLKNNDIGRELYAINDSVYADIIECEKELDIEFLGNDMDSVYNHIRDVVDDLSPCCNDDRVIISKLLY